MQPEPFDLKAEEAKCWANLKAFREKERRMHDLMRATVTEREFKKMGHLTWMRFKIWAQEQVGIPVTKEQRREVGYEYWK